MIWHVPCSLSKSGIKNQFSACSRVSLQWPPQAETTCKKTKQEGLGHVGLMI